MKCNAMQCSAVQCNLQEAGRLSAGINEGSDETYLKSMLMAWHGMAADHVERAITWRRGQSSLV